MRTKDRVVRAARRGTKQKRPQTMRDALDLVLDLPARLEEKPYTPITALTRDELAAYRIICQVKIDEARSGDTDAARAIITDCIRAVEETKERRWPGPTHYSYASYIADAFRKILSGEDPLRALGIKRENGRPKGATTFKPRALAAAYWLLRRKGRKSEQAISDLTRITGADRSTIQRATKARYTSGFKRPERVSDAALLDEIAMQPYAEKIRRLLAADSQSGPA